MAEEKTIGFDRKEFGSLETAGSAAPPSLHLFVCHSSATLWSPRFEEPSSLVSTLQKALKDRKSELRTKFGSVKVTVAEVLTDAGDNEGDVLVFPDCKRWSRAAEDPDAFVEALLTGEGAERASELDRTASVFVCAHSQRDSRCGYCGPKLIEAMRSAAPTRLWVRACSHVGGHIYAGNVIVMRHGKPADWFGYVAPGDVPAIVALCDGDEAHLPVHLWRGREGMTKEEHSLACTKCGGAQGDIEDLGAGFGGSEAHASEKLRVIFVLGGPGSGKGTQCAQLLASFGARFAHLSAGDLLRAERKNPKSADGALILACIAEGRIVPGEITVKLILKAMRAAKAAAEDVVFLIDGFPRSEGNLESWAKVVGNAAEVEGVFFFDCPESVLESRLLERGKTSGRADDNCEAIRKRFKTYMEQTMPIVHHFERINKVWTVDTNRPVADIFATVCTTLRHKEILSPSPDVAPASALTLATKKLPPMVLLAAAAAAAAAAVAAVVVMRRK